MGLLARAVRSVIPTNGLPVSFPQSSQLMGFSSAGQNYARIGYGGNEIVYAIIELLATSAAEPHIIGRRNRRASPQIKAEIQNLTAKGLKAAAVNQLLVRNGFVEPLPMHPLVKLLNNPNPYMSRGQLWSTVVMDLSISGNAYVAKARYSDGPLGGAVAELWRLRPDKIKIVPDAEQFCRYEYRVGRDVMTFAYRDVMHFKLRNPFDEYYGLSPMAVLVPRLQVDSAMREFLRNFYAHGGTGPGAMLTSKQKLTKDAREEIKDNYSAQYSTPGSFRRLLVLDATETTYQQFGLNRGIRDALPKEIDAQSEARIAMVFGVPGSIVGLLIGYESSSYANKRQDWQVLWDVKMTPLLSDLDDVMNLSLIPDFGGIDEVLFDLGDIKALQEDVTALWTRYGVALEQGAITLEQFCDFVGLEMATEGHYLIPNHKIVVRAQELDKAVEPITPPPAPPQLPAPAARVLDVAHCSGCGNWIGRDVNVGATVYCRNCKEVEIKG